MEDDMGEPGDDEALDDFFQLKKKAQRLLRHRNRPKVDETLYFL
jgi:hypothetical protein